MAKQITVLTNKAALSVYMAELFVVSAEKQIAANGYFSVALSGGGTPQSIYELLASERFASRVNWKKVHVFWGDERCVPSDAEGSNYKQAWDAFLSKVPVPKANLYRVKTEFECEVAAHDYMRQLESFALGRQPAGGPKWPLFDMVLLGMGSDGHTASIFPDSPVCTDQPTRVAMAEYDGRPAARVTLTESVLNDARNLYVLLSGGSKAAMLKTVLEDARDDVRYPILRIRPKNGSLNFILDTDAAALLS